MKPIPSLQMLSPKQIERLLARSNSAYEGYVYSELHELGRSGLPEQALEIKRLERQSDVGASALRLCLSQLALHPDPSLLPALVEAYRVWSYNSDSFHHLFQKRALHSVSQALRDLLQCEGVSWDTLVAMPALKAWVHSSEMSLRRDIAQVLPLTHPTCLEWLRELAQDPVPSVRQVAQERLGTVQDIPWWWGIFSSDPLPRLPKELEPDALQARQADWMAARDLLAKAELEPEAWETLLSRLSPEEAVDLVAQRCRDFALVERHLEKVLPWLLQRPEDSLRLVPLLEVWSEQQRVLAIFRVEEVLDKALLALPDDTRQACCETWLQALQQKPLDSWGPSNTPLSLLAKMVGKHWSPQVDPGPVVEWLLSLPEDNQGRPGESYLTDLLERTEALSEELQGQIWKALDDGLPGTWKKLARVLPPLLRRMFPERWRSRVLQRLSEETDATLRGELLEERIGPVHDPERDAPPEELLSDYLNDPNWLPIVLESSRLSLPVLPTLRRWFLDKPWTFPLAFKLLCVVNGAHPSTESYPYSYGEERLSSLGGTDKSVEPISPEEWGRFRAMRDAHTFDSLKEMAQAVCMVPPGPWDPSDRAFFERFVAVLRQPEQKEEDSDPIFVLGLLAMKASLEDQELFEELASHCKHDHLKRVFAYHFRKKLNLPLANTLLSDWEE